LLFTFDDIGNCFTTLYNLHSVNGGFEDDPRWNIIDMYSINLEVVPWNFKFGEHVETLKMIKFLDKTPTMNLKLVTG